MVGRGSRVWTPLPVSITGLKSYAQALFSFATTGWLERNAERATPARGAGEAG